MVNVALTAMGAKVVLATSSDENYPPENIIDGNADTFWISTGMFPQEFIIRFPNTVKITMVTIHSYNDNQAFFLQHLAQNNDFLFSDSVKDLQIEKSTSDEISDLETLAEKEYECTEGHLQTSDFSVARCHKRYPFTIHHYVGL